MSLNASGGTAYGALYSKIALGVAISFQATLCLISLNTCLFWDTIQFASRHPSHYYYGGGFWLPEAINSGNPPLLGWIVLAAWEGLGRELWVTHLVTWPFLAANIALLFRIGNKLSPGNGGWLPLLWLSIPVYAAQSTLVSPDILLVTGLLLIIHSLYYPQKLLLTIGGVLLGLVSLRGASILSVILVWWVLDSRYRRHAVALLPGVLMALAFHAMHFLHFGWALVPARSPWTGNFDRPGPDIWLRQAGIWIWRMIDHGLVFLWLAILAVKPWRKWSLAWRPESILLLLMMGLFASFFIFFDGLNMHRYLLPVFLGGVIWFFIHGNNSPQLRSCLAMLLLAGNLWIYPTGTAKGWDSTLAWLPWSWHRQHILEGMLLNRIDPAATASSFPNLGPIDEVDLSRRREVFLPLEKLDEASYFIYSNVFNDLADSELEMLEHWKPIAESGEWPVKVTLLEKPQNEIP